MVNKATIEKHDNQIFLAVRDYLTSYVTFPDPVYSDVCALWAIGTHLFRRFDSFGYLVITASTKRAGKSVLAELLSFISHDGKIGTSMTASVLRRLVGRGATVFFDEAESLNSEAASSVREYLNIGYRAGQSVFMPGIGPDDVIEYPAYSPKCFILIGDPNDTLRDRSIAIEMRRATAPKIYRRSEAVSCADTLQGGKADDKGNTPLTYALETITADDMLTYDDAYNFLDARSAEIWSPILALARVLAPSRMDAILACAADVDSVKQTAEKKSFRKVRESAEHAATDESFRERALRDLASVFHDHERAIHTETALVRMKAIITSPWRTYQGSGLTAVTLSDLLATFCASKSIKINGKVKRGFQKADILQGMKTIEGAK